MKNFSNLIRKLEKKTERSLSLVKNFLNLVRKSKKNSRYLIESGVEDNWAILPQYFNYLLSKKMWVI